jgi:hypothetical protein
MDNQLQCVNDVIWNNIAHFYSDSRNHSCDVCNGNMKSKVHDNYVFKGHNRMRGRDLYASVERRAESGERRFGERRA